MAKRIHLAEKIASGGRVSAACFDPPRAINLKRATWTIRPEAVTCPRCLALIAHKGMAWEQKVAIQRGSI